MSGQRLWYVDALRAWMMILGVFLHAAGVYAVSTSFVVRDPSDQPALDVLVALVHSCRMPAFFLLAGMFWTHGVRSASLGPTLKRRLALVSLPFLTLALTLQPLQHAALLAQQKDGWDFGLATFWNTFVSPGVLGPNQFTGRGFVGHLWFLPVLLTYYLLAAACAPLLGRLDQRLPVERGLVLLRHKWLCGLLAAIAMVALRSVLRHRLGVPTDYANLLVYLPHFAIGAIGFSRPERFAALRHVGPVDLLLWAASTPLVFHPDVQAWAGGAALLLAKTYFSLMTTVLLLRIFQRWLDRPGRWLQRMVDASYSIYLFHYFCVVSLALLLLPLALPRELKFAIVVAVGVLAPYALHHGVLNRSPLLRLLFNGRWSGRPRTAAAPAPEPAATPDAATAA